MPISCSTDTIDPVQLKQDFPSISLAYPLAVAAYDLALKRYEAVDSRIQTIITLTATLTMAVPGIAWNKGVPFHNLWFYLALASFVITLVSSVYVRLSGHLQIPSLPVLYSKEWLALDELVFMQQFIAHAATAQTTNVNLIERKHRACLWFSFLFGLEIIFLVLWISRPFH